jgi:hypothetical protein
MFIWLIATFSTTCFFTVFAASLYWSMDKSPWRGLLTALSMAMVGVGLMVFFHLFRNGIEVALLAKILYAFAMIQAILQWAIAWKKKRLIDANRR